MGRTKGSKNKIRVFVPSMPPVKIIPRPPQKIVTIPGDLPEILKLNNGEYLDIGDVFWHVRKFVIKKITKTAGDNTVEVEAECTKRHWQRNLPS